MRSIKAFLILALVTLASCSENKIYTKFERNFDDNRWQKTDVRTHEFELTQGATNYNIYLHLSHVHGFQFPSIPIMVELEKPDKTIVRKGINIKVLAEDGKDIGDCAGDYCDLEEVIFDNEPLAVGKYKLKISQQFPSEYLPNILGVGIEVSTAFD